MSDVVLSRVGRRKERTRKLLLDVALQLFHEQGIYWTKIEDITERADVGKGTFYQHFETKEALLRELLAIGLSDLFERMRAAVATEKPGFRAVEAVIGAELDFYLDRPEYLLVFHQIRGLLQLQREAIKDLREVYTDHLNRVGHLLHRFMTAKGVKVSVTRELGMALSAYTSGLMTYHLLFEGTDLKRRREQIVGQLARSLRALL